MARGGDLTTIPPATEVVFGEILVETLALYGTTACPGKPIRYAWVHQKDSYGIA